MYLTLIEKVKSNIVHVVSDILLSDGTMGGYQKIVSKERQIIKEIVVCNKK